MTNRDGEGLSKGPTPRRFRPTFWATVCALAAVVVLLGLGTWQMQRLGWKEALIAERLARSQGPAAALPAAFDDPRELDFTRAAVDGKFLHDKELYLGSRTHKKAVGVHVVTPFRLDDGRALLIDRGWVPMDRQDPATRAEGQIAGPLELEVILRRGGWKGGRLFRPENSPEQNLWLWPDLPVMAAAAGLDRPITAVYAEAVASEVPGGYPIGGLSRIALRNDHLQYALTWYALAFALVVIYIIYSMKPVDGRSPR